ncbi:MAG: KamA family radical SAM protein, partial [Nitrospirae bacterium]
KKKAQLRARIRDVESLARALGAGDILAATGEAVRRFPMAITPYYASLIRRLDDSDPIFAMAVPHGDEVVDPPFLSDDPLEEVHDSPVPNLVHRYRDRALLLVTSTCAMYCRHCTRKRVAGQQASAITDGELAVAVGYLKAHPEIHDVILSGGDPLTLPTERLEQILRAVRAVESVEVIRIGSRTPVTLPMRITDRLVAMLRRFHPIWINTHFNHPVELTPEAREACARIADAGIPLGNQTVLLRGVNDDPKVLEALFRGLVRNRVRPYYLFQCDLVRGVERFRTPLAKGIEIMEYLRGRVSGIAIPTFVVDAPGGGGKIPLLPNYVVSMSPTHTVLRNFEGVLLSYPEPTTLGDAHHGEANHAPRRESAPGVWELASGEYSAIQPSCSVRHAGRDPQTHLAPTTTPPENMP